MHTKIARGILPLVVFSTTLSARVRAGAHSRAGPSHLERGTPAESGDVAARTSLQARLHELRAKESAALSGRCQRRQRQTTGPTPIVRFEPVVFAGRSMDRVHVIAHRLLRSVPRPDRWLRPGAPHRSSGLRRSGDVLSRRRVDRVRLDPRGASRHLDAGPEHAQADERHPSSGRRLPAGLVARWTMDCVLVGSRFGATCAWRTRRSQLRRAADHRDLRDSP